MQKSSFLTLLAVTILVVAAAVFSVLHGDRTVTPVGQGQPALPGLTARLGYLAWMRVEHGAMTADFAQIGGQWTIVEKGNYPASAARVRRVLVDLADLTLVEPKTKLPDFYARLGLDDPRNGQSTLISLQDRTGAKLGELVIGKSRPDLLGGDENGIYVRKPGDPQTWLARGSIDLPKDIVGWLNRTVIDIAPSRVATVAMTGADGVTLSLKRDPGSGHFTVVDAPPDAKLKTPAVLALPANALAGMEFLDVQPAADLPVPKDGIQNDTFTTLDGLTVKVRLFTQGTTDWIALGAEGDSKAAEALNARLVQWVFAIPPGRARLLRTRLSDLVEPAKGS